jgi:hypothetical protein
MSRPGTEPGPPAWEARKEPSRQLVNGYSEHLQSTYEPATILTNFTFHFFGCFLLYLPRGNEGFKNAQFVG